MTLSKHLIGEYIELVIDTNDEMKYGPMDVVGMTITKEIIPTKANVADTDLSKFIIVQPGDFIYNPRTHGKKIGFGYNDSEQTFLISWNNVAFRIKQDKKTEMLADYLFLHFNRNEWDREACYRSWGSSTEVFSWDALCEMEIEVPPLPIQQKYVDVYKAMVVNQQSYERGLEDLKLVCDAFLDQLKYKNKAIRIGEFIRQIDNKNVDNNPYRFAGLSMDNYFINSIADDTGLDFTKYKTVAPNQYGAVLMKVGRDGRLTIARNTSDECYLISPAYYTFELFGINPEYFMASINRPEFERRGWFSCDTSARGSLSWDEFLDLKIPSANEKEQLIISNLYKVQMQRYGINERLKTKMREMCPILIKGSIEESRKGA